MSIVSYNGVTLPMALHTSFRQEAVGDDLSDTDRIYTKFDIEVSTVINEDYLEALSPRLIGKTTSAADIMANIRQLLLQRRKTLSVTCNGSELIPPRQQGGSPSPGVSSSALDGTVDAKNGPIPQYCNIVRMTNVTFLVTYRIIAHYWENNGPQNTNPTLSVPTINQQGNHVLYNRWTEAIEMDEADYVTRTREGKFIIRSDNAQGFIASQLIPQMAVVGVPDGFIRLSSRYMVSPDGLAIQYRVVDKEQHRLPVQPSFRTQASYTESLGGPQATFRYGECHVRMVGNKETSQSEMAKNAIAFCLAKLTTREQDLFTLLGEVKAIPQSGSITIDLIQNIVDVRLRAWMNPSDKTRVQGIWALGWDNICESPNDGETPIYSALGTASRLLQAAAYYDPSIPTTTFDEQQGQLTDGLEVGQAGVLPETLSF